MATPIMSITFLIPSVSATTDQFQTWYPEFGLALATILKDNCTTTYTKYLTGVKSDSYYQLYRSMGAGLSN